MYFEDAGELDMGKVVVFMATVLVFAFTVTLF